MAGMCGVTQEQPYEEETDVLLPELDRILTLTAPDAKQLTTSLSFSEWLLNPNCTGEYATIHSEQFVQTLSSVSIFQINHRMDAVFTALCNGDRTNPTWIGCPTHAKQTALLFKHLLLLDGEGMPSAPLTIVLYLFESIREAYHVTKALIRTANPKEPALLESVHQMTKTIAALKRRASTTGVTLALAIRYAHADDFDQLCVELNGLCEELIEEQNINKGAGPPSDIHIKPDMGIPLSSKEQKKLLHVLT